jgi:excisionase family DNA binding protein
MTLRAQDDVAEIIAALPLMLTVLEAADLLRTTRRNVQRMLADGRLVALQPTGIKGKVLIPRASIARMLGASIAMPRKTAPA